MNADIGWGTPLADDQVGLVVEVFRMLADVTRVQVLWALATSESDGELSVNELAERVGKPAPSVSQHLAKLRAAVDFINIVRMHRAWPTFHQFLLGTLFGLRNMSWMAKTGQIWE